MYIYVFLILHQQNSITFAGQESDEDSRQVSPSLLVPLQDKRGTQVIEEGQPAPSSLRC